MMKELVFIMMTAFLAIFSCNRPAKTTGDSGAAEDMAAGYRLTEVWKSDTPLLVPESVLYDKARGVLYASDLNFEPRQKDGNGFISRLSADGEILDLMWVGEMSSPKGMALVGNRLYVADVDELIEVNVDEGKITGRWILEGARMLNDITADETGALYISDTDGNCIYRFKDGSFKVWLEGLSGPNGLLWEPGRLMMAATGSQDFSAIDLQTGEVTLVADSIGAGDGIVSTGKKGDYIVSDWSGRIFHISPDGSKELLLELAGDQEQTADIGFIEKDMLLLVPTFFGNRVIAYRLEE